MSNRRGKNFSVRSFSWNDSLCFIYIERRREFEFAPATEGRHFVVTKVPPLGEAVSPQYCGVGGGFLPPTTIEQLPPREGFLCLRAFTLFTYSK